MHPTDTFESKNNGLAYPRGTKFDTARKYENMLALLRVIDHRYRDRTWSYAALLNLTMYWSKVTQFSTYKRHKSVVN